MESTFESQYEKLEFIARGTFGKVYKCKRKSDSVMFAVKEIDLEKDDILRQTFKEITIMEKTQDTPYMVKYIQHFQLQDKILIVMELAEGGNLYQYLKKKQRLDSEEIEVILYQLLLAVKQLHEMKIMHRDIKTENILKVKHGIKLGDLGLSTLVNGSLDGADSFNGTPIFNAPERFKKGYDFNVDIWSVGMVLYQILQNSLPPYPEVYNGQRDSIDSCYPQHIRDILDDMLILDPAKRPFVHEVLSKLMWSRSISTVKLCFDGQIHQGPRVNSLLQGLGTCYYPNGDRYDGYWVQGKRHGFGTYYCVNGRNFNGNWINDQLPQVDQSMLTGNKCSMVSGHSLQEQNIIRQLQAKVAQLSEQNQTLLNVRKALISKVQQQESQSHEKFKIEKDEMSLKYQQEIQIREQKYLTAEIEINKLVLELQQEKQKHRQSKQALDSQKKQIIETLDELQGQVQSNCNLQKIHNELEKKVKKLESKEKVNNSEIKSLQKKNNELQKENEKLQLQQVQLQRKQEQLNGASKQQLLPEQSPVVKSNFENLSNSKLSACVFQVKGCKAKFLNALELSNHQQSCSYNDPKATIQQHDALIQGHQLQNESFGGSAGLNPPARPGVKAPMQNDSYAVRPADQQQFGRLEGLGEEDFLPCEDPDWKEQTIKDMRAALQAGWKKLQQEKEEEEDILRLIEKNKKQR